ncbi:hypothetical protein INR49_019787 [Caranx melampygus]|nr:hypothetical protein INR49_019787 [Caranx melampygus]
MPRAFLVKKANVSPGKRNWSELPDHERGDVYIPVSLLPPSILMMEAEASPAEMTPLCLTKRSVSDSWTHAELPSSTVLGRPRSTEASPEERSEVRRRSQGGSTHLDDNHPCHLRRCRSPRAGPHGDQIDRSGSKFIGGGDAGVRLPGLSEDLPVPADVEPTRQCTLCEKAFTQRCSLESHMKKIHSVTLKYAYKERRNKLYVCEECGHTAGAQDELLIHLHSYHPNSALLKGKAARRAGGGGGGGGKEEQSAPGSPQGADSDDTTGSAGQ